MDAKTLKRLEYHKIIEQLAEHAGSPLGQEMILELSPSDNIELIKKWQSETTEGRELMRLDPSAEIGGWYDIRVQVENSRRGIMLDPEDLLAVGRTVYSIKRVKKFFLDRQDKYPLLAEIAGFMGNFGNLDGRIKDSIMPGGEISDHASSTLVQLRRKLTSAQAQIKSRLESFTRSANYQKYLQDPIVTIRENRFVIPVKQEDRNQIPGIVHDQSASGATLFIEPMAVVEANNEARRLQAAEKQEIIRILSELSAAVSLVSDDLIVSLEAAARLDFIMAKARYSLKLKAWSPEIKSGTFINIKNGRHPLLSGEVVPISIHLGHQFDTLVITGPNTGGKTVTLKTIGLLVLMAYSGLHIPVDDGSVLGVFNSIYADIGDEQSIEQSLSTFSSHMINIVDILTKARDGSLVLLDELGAGTDPAEGSALAKAILEKLHDSGAKTVATTHYSELKNFAYANKRVENASVEFDVVSLRPTYRLLIGQPGRSNAFEIAGRLGMEPLLVKRARQFMSADQVEADELMDQLEKMRQEAARDREDAAKAMDEARIYKERHQNLERAVQEKRESILAKAREEASSKIREVRRDSEELIRELREKLSSSAAREREMGIQEARIQLLEMENKNTPKPGSYDCQSGQILQEVCPGQEVFIPKFNQKGFVLSVPENEQVQVQVGILKVFVPLTELRYTEQSPKDSGKTQVAGIMATKARNISTSLDLRGLTADEALDQMDKYIDDARLAGLPRVYIIHGKGTGALRAAIQEHLHEYIGIKSFRLGEAGEGGMGCTVVDL